VPIVLFRVDERLIHGQVVVGWGERVHMDRIVVVDDDLRSSAWEQELYCLGVPPHVDAVFADVDEARQVFRHWVEETRRLVILVRDVDTLSRLAADGVLGDQEINLGGIHHAPGRARVLPYLYLNDREREQLERIREAGLRITARDLPGSRAVPLDELLRGS
jgi:mannose/fructose/N-acetylgalactosamine-specific phosphotransferase system component IIB